MRHYRTIIYIFSSILFALLIGLPSLVVADNQLSGLLFETKDQEYGEIQVDAAIWLKFPGRDFRREGVPQLVAPDVHDDQPVTSASSLSPCSNSYSVLAAPPLGILDKTTAKAKTLLLWDRLADWAFNHHADQNYNILIWSPLRDVDHYQLVPNWQIEEEPVKNLAMWDLPCCNELAFAQVLPNQSNLNF